MANPRAQKGQIAAKLRRFQPHVCNIAAVEYCAINSKFTKMRLLIVVGFVYVMSAVAFGLGDYSSCVDRCAEMAKTNGQFLACTAKCDDSKTTFLSAKLTQEECEDNCAAIAKTNGQYVACMHRCAVMQPEHTEEQKEMTHEQCVNSCGTWAETNGQYMSCVRRCDSITSESLQVLAPTLPKPRYMKCMSRCEEWANGPNSHARCQKQCAKFGVPSLPKSVQSIDQSIGCYEACVALEDPVSISKCIGACE